MYIFSFDVESFSLWGTGYSVGIAIWRGSDLKTGVASNRHLFSVDRDLVDARQEDRDWADANVPRVPVTHQFLEDMRSDFWALLQEAMSHKAKIVVDCGVPVEANFINACVKDNYEERKWQAPYPLHELATVLFGRGLDPLQNFSRKDDELPKHNPLCDALQSGRLWLEHFRQEF